MNDACPTSDAARHAFGFLSIRETAALAGRGIVLPDPCSVLVSADVVLEDHVILWPNVILQTSAEGRITIGCGTILFPGTRIVASGGLVTIGAGAEIREEGGFTIQGGNGRDDPG